MLTYLVVVVPIPARGRGEPDVEIATITGPLTVQVADLFNGLYKTTLQTLQ